MKEKILLIVVCIAGLSAVFYGMAEKHDVVFIIGLILVIGAYLVIRKRLKASLEGIDERGVD
ncbi:MAG: hypothetical protein P8175_14425 [Deltaproteobacteria bacterium]